MYKSIINTYNLQDVGRKKYRELTNKNLSPKILSYPIDIM